jgi:hypothetical protein
MQEIGWSLIFLFFPPNLPAATITTGLPACRQSVGFAVRAVHGDRFSRLDVDPRRWQEELPQRAIFAGTFARTSAVPNKVTGCTFSRHI